MLANCDAGVRPALHAMQHKFYTDVPKNLPLLQGSSVDIRPPGQFYLCARSLVLSFSLSCPAGKT